MTYLHQNLHPKEFIQLLKKVNWEGDKLLPGIDISGSVLLTGYPVKSLPKGLEIHGCLFLKGTQIKVIPVDIEVDRISLPKYFWRNVNIEELPLYVNIFNKFSKEDQRYYKQALSGTLSIPDVNLFARIVRNIYWILLTIIPGLPKFNSREVY